MVDLNILRSFVTAARAGSFGRAAARRGITRSAISQQMSAIERQLGVRLFERGGRGVTLSPEGHQLYASVHGLFESIDVAVEDLNADRGRGRGLVRLGAPSAFFAEWARPRVVKLLREHPGLRLSIQFKPISELSVQLSEGLLDLAILIGAPRRQRLVCEQIYVETFVAVASSTYVAKHGAPLTLDQFLEHPYLVCDDDLFMHREWWVSAFGDDAPLPQSIVIQVSNVLEMLGFVEAGCGIAVLPDFLFKKALASGKLVELKPRAPVGGAPIAPIFLAWREQAVTPARVESVKRALLFNE